jgi:hypothetical protein
MGSSLASFRETVGFSTSRRFILAHELPLAFLERPAIYTQPHLDAKSLSILRTDSTPSAGERLTADQGTLDKPRMGAYSLTDSWA